MLLIFGAYSIIFRDYLTNSLPSPSSVRKLWFS